MSNLSNSPSGRMQAWLEKCLEQAPAAKLGPVRFLEVNADHAEKQLKRLSAWADDTSDRPCPADLEGINASELVAVVEALHAEAERYRRRASAQPIHPAGA